MSSDFSGAAKRIAALRDQIAQLDYICSGNLRKRSLVCGKRNCRCKADPPELHGPYYYWSRLLGGKVVQKVLTQEQARLVKAAIANYREARKLLRRWEAETTRIVEKKKEKPKF